MVGSGSTFLAIKLGLVTPLTPCRRVAIHPDNAAIDFFLLRVALRAAHFAVSAIEGIAGFIVIERRGVPFRN